VASQTERRNTNQSNLSLFTHQILVGLLRFTNQTVQIIFSASLRGNHQLLIVI